MEKKVILFVFVFTSFYLYSQNGDYLIDFEEEGKTMKMFNEAFVSENEVPIDVIADDEFYQNGSKDLLMKWLKGSTVDYAYVIEKCKVTFKVKEDERFDLYFVRSADKRQWFPLTAKLNSRNGQKLKPRGFSGLEHTRNFSGFIKAFDKLDENYLSFFPRGLINAEFAKNNKFQLDHQKEYVFENVILRKIKSKESVLLIVTLKFHPFEQIVFGRKKSGWLLHKVQRGEDYYLAGESIFHDTYFGRDRKPTSDGNFLATNLRNQNRVNNYQNEEEFVILDRSQNRANKVNILDLDDLTVKKIVIYNNKSDGYIRVSLKVNNSYNTEELLNLFKTDIKGSLARIRGSFTISPHLDKNFTNVQSEKVDLFDSVINLDLGNLPVYEVNVVHDDSKNLVYFDFIYN